MRKLTVQSIPIGQLVPYSGNARTHSKQQIKQIARSIAQYEFINPVLIDENNQIVAGHGRYLAAIELGLTTLPCIRIDHLTEAEKRAYTLADNKLAENAGWDSDLLRVEIEYLTQMNFDVELTGFSMPEIDGLFAVSDSAVPEPPVPALPDPKRVVTRPGDVWQLGRHRILCGDCRDPQAIDSLMDRSRVRLVLTDPPYNVPVDGHATGLGRIRHRNFAMASGELTAAEFIRFLSGSLNQLSRASLD